MQKITLEGIEITLAAPEPGGVVWIDYNNYVRHLEAAWARLSDDDPPLNPRLIGEPGGGKTTLARFVGQQMGREVYIFQCTLDTRPEDLLVTPVLCADENGQRKIEYRASAVVSAMLRGGVLILDEGSRMPERAWASLAPLLDDRRSADSAVTGLKLVAHPDFRIAVTMNDDASTFELPGYIQSRLKPKIEVSPPPFEIQEQIVRANCPGVSDEILREVLADLKRRDEDNIATDSIRDVLAYARLAQSLKKAGVENALAEAARGVLADSAFDDEYDEEDD